ncbi:O-succinylbenzoic acid--CoA ligase [Kocuria coralli]|uniref:O-succinylbenzoic acid--CoA ligase n=1 Tax=Kocuria coralli TaxID=1461025 RepID=A0A5J5L1I6_9MICC|nr:O-succinylbenzoic acid--CoA ligase [Kocuria coralli]
MLLDGPESVTAVGGVAGLLDSLRGVLRRPGPAVVVATSGSTGRPKRTVLSTEALMASATATARRTGGPGQWLLCLPAYYVAGLQVLVRSVVAGTEPVLAAPGHFTAAGFAEAAEHLTGLVRYVSLVPTQLQRLVSGADDPEVLRALRSFTAILLGGSAVSPALLERARELGARVITTYGMSETAGGCVYDGVALPGVRVHIGDEPPAGPDTPTSGATLTGRIWLGGPVVTDGYLDDPEQTARHVFAQEPAAAAESAAATRWYRTDDLGELTEQEGQPRLRVTGRADDVFVTGGVKVSGGVLRLTLLEDPLVEDAAVVGLEDPVWGQRIAAVVVPGSPPPDPASFTDGLAQRVRDELGSPAVPKDWRLVEALPLLPTGKPDPARIRALFTVHGAG